MFKARKGQPGTQAVQSQCSPQRSAIRLEDASQPLLFLTLSSPSVPRFSPPPLAYGPFSLRSRELGLLHATRKTPARSDVRSLFLWPATPLFYRLRKIESQ